MPYQDLRVRAFELSVLMFKIYPRLAAAGLGHAVIARQLFRAIASIGANLEEGAAPGSRREIGLKHVIALREAREANYWARLAATDPVWTEELGHVIDETREFVAMLTASVRKLRRPDPRSLALFVFLLSSFFLMF